MFFFEEILINKIVKLITTTENKENPISQNCLIIFTSFYIKKIG